MPRFAIPLSHDDVDYHLHLMSGVEELFDDPEFTDEDVENMLEEMRDKYTRRIAH